MKITKQEIIDAIAEKYLKSTKKTVKVKKVASKRPSQSLAMKKSWAKRKRKAKKEILEVPQNNIISNISLK